MSSRSGVFLSYARADGLPFAMRLHAWLKENSVPVWRDLVAMEGGRDWWLQITEALDHVEYMLLVMTPAALRSETCRKEWRYARQRGVCVYPVWGVPAEQLDISQLPRWMRDAQWYNLPAHQEQWTRLLNDLSRTCQTRRVPFMVEDLPEGFVPRPAEFDALVNLLRDPAREEPVAMTAALRGAGGFGKTTLAKALCHDERIQEAFDDGILWVTLGQNPANLNSKILDLIEVLSTDGERPGFENTETAAARLAELLADRDILMVVDDVWNAADLAPFLRGGKRCARLVTTRNRDTLPASARSLDVDAMRPIEATAVLSGGLPEGFEAELRALGRRLGEWPVLLKLVNGVLCFRVHDARQPLVEALAYINEDLDENGLTAFDAGNSEQRDRAVAATLAISFQLLGADRPRYEELAIFPEDVDIPLSMLEKLWSKTGTLSRVKVEKLCERLSSLSLVQKFDLATRTLRLHDVVRSCLSRNLENAAAAGLHANLIDTWGDLRHLRDDYAWRWVAFHLRDAGREVRLRELLFDFDWLRAKLEATEIAALIDDYDLLLEPARRWCGYAPVEPPGRKIGIPPWRIVDAPATAERAGEDEDDPARLIQGALRLSAHVLAKDKAQLAGQLTGRLLGEEGEAIVKILEQAAAWRDAAWLKPITPSLTSPGGPLVRTLVGHEDSVTAVAVTPDGKLIISGSDDGTVKVWEVASGREARTLAGHDGKIADVAVTPDGKLAISASVDGTAKVWDIESGRELHNLAGHARGIAMTPDGKLAISGSADETLKVWEVGSGCEVRTLEGYSGRAVAVTPDGKLAISAQGTLEVWDVQSGHKVRKSLWHDGSFTAVAVTPDGRLAISASYGTVKVWEVESSREVRTLEGLGSVVAVTPDGRLAISSSGDDDHTLKIWEVQSGQVLRTLAGHRDHVNAVAVTPDGKLAISGSDDKTLKVWDLGTNREARHLPGHSEEVNAVAVTPDGRLAISGSSDQTLKIWEVRSGREIRTLAGHSSDVITAGDVIWLAVLPDGKLAISVSRDETVKMWDVGSGQEVWTFQADDDEIDAMAVTPGGNLDISALDEGILQVSEAGSGKWRILTMANNVAVTPDGERLIYTSLLDNTLRVGDVLGGQELGTLTGHNQTVRAVAVTPDGKLAVSGSCDETVKVWDINSEREVLNLSGHSDEVTAVAVTPDGKLAISASDDRTLRLWELASGEPVCTFTAEANLTSCAAAPDGRTILAGDESGRVHFLQLIQP